MPERAQAIFREIFKDRDFAKFPLLRSDFERLLEDPDWKMLIVGLEDIDKSVAELTGKSTGIQSMLAGKESKLITFLAMVCYFIPEVVFGEEGVPRGSVSAGVISHMLYGMESIDLQVGQRVLENSKMGLALDIEASENIAAMKERALLELNAIDRIIEGFSRSLSLGQDAVWESNNDGFIIN